MCDAPAYMTVLRRFLEQELGVEIYAQREFLTWEDVQDFAEDRNCWCVVNCCGLGGPQLWRGAELTPTAML